MRFVDVSIPGTYAPGLCALLASRFRFVTLYYEPVNEFFECNDNNNPPIGLFHDCTSRRVEYGHGQIMYLNSANSAHLAAPRRLATVHHGCGSSNFYLLMK